MKNQKCTFALEEIFLVNFLQKLKMKIENCVQQHHLVKVIFLGRLFYLSRVYKKQYSPGLWT